MCLIHRGFMPNAEQAYQAASASRLRNRRGICRTPPRGQTVQSRRESPRLEPRAGGGKLSGTSNSSTQRRTRQLYCTCLGSNTVRGRWRDPLQRSEEHTSELQSRGHLVCRLLLEKKKTA